MSLAGFYPFPAQPQKGKRPRLFIPPAAGFRVTERRNESEMLAVSCHSFALLKDRPFALIQDRSLASLEDRSESPLRLFCFQDTRIIAALENVLVDLGPW